MAEGIRIQHPTERSVTYTIVARDRPLAGRSDCPPPCGRVHEFKTYHIRLDAEGAAIVSSTIWERLRSIPTQPFVPANIVKHPPTTVIGVLNPGADAPPVLEHLEV